MVEEGTNGQTRSLPTAQNVQSFCKILHTGFVGLELSLRKTAGTLASVRRQALRHGLWAGDLERKTADAANGRVVPEERPTKHDCGPNTLAEEFTPAAWDRDWLASLAAAAAPQAEPTRGERRRAS